MKRIFLTIITLIAVAVLGTVSFFVYDYVDEKNSLQFSLIPSPTNDSASNFDSSTASSTGQFATSTASTSSWKTYANDELGFSLKYPADLIRNDDITSLILVFPSKSYFHWPLEDEVKATIIASSTCSKLDIGGDYGNISTSTLTIGGQKFIRKEGFGAAAGNIYKEIIYDIKGNGTCYSFIFNFHGGNGAGMYVNDQVLVKKYDDQHQVDVDSVMNIIYGILDSFELRKTPDGELEG